MKDKIIEIINKSVDNEDYRGVFNATWRDSTSIAYEEANAFSTLVNLLKQEFDIKNDEIKVITW